ncbi:MAG: hypothetical protein JSV81_22545 [Anaerolineales bacterium]|nr:MAG: hypothetical protein JSV81_22545 [Anaerolineales bacterium]
MATYSFWTIRIDELAETLSQVLGIRLYRQYSPMIGTWYTDINLATFVKALKEGKEVSPTDYSHTLELVLNEPARGVRPPEFSGRVECSLRVEADPDAYAEIEEKLRQSGLRFRLLRE